MATKTLALGDFEGQWHLEREIIHHDGTRATLEGTATWTRDGDLLVCVEEGLLRIGAAAPLTARQTYLWDADLKVLFEDGRLFHRVPHAGGAVGHWCPPDQYDGVYDFAAWGRGAFEVAWNVVGPRKDYRMKSRFSRSSRI